VRAWDPDSGVLEQAISWHEHDLAAEDDSGTRVRSLTAAASLEQAVGDADYVQESGPERLDVKREIYALLDRAAPDAAVLASSTSAIDMSSIAQGLAGAPRCIVAHPVNPPHVVPVVEVCAGQATSQDTVLRTMGFLREVGQSPLLLARYIPGFVVNRLQMALLREALSLLDGGVASADAIDAAVRDGLGLRWAIMGPFAVANTNADGGAREYLTRYGPSITYLMGDLGASPVLDAAFIERVGRATDALEHGASRTDLREWRDRLVRGIVALKADDPHPGTGG
jgi:3-hydroxyacyl-CoA dehydrogenase